MKHDKVIVFTSNRHYENKDRKHHKHDKCCSQSVFHDKCDKCGDCKKCCTCPKPLKHKHHDKCEHGNKCHYHEHKHCDCHDDPVKKKDHAPEVFGGFDDGTVTEEAGEYSFMDQESAELIWVKESCNIKVQTTNTQVGLSLQAALQLAISFVLKISLADSNEGEAVSQELLQKFSLEQTNKQKIYIYNTKDANVYTTDTDLAVNIQLLLQVLVALVVMIDIL